MISKYEIEKYLHTIYKDDSFSPSTIYHYTDASVIEKILTTNGIKLRMTRVSDFSDIYEGKSIGIYYDMALEQLESEGKISASQKELLNSVELPEKRIALFGTQPPENNPQIMASSLKMTPYVICFSKNKCDSYMFKNYLKTEKQGYCIEFYGHDIASNSNMLSFSKGYKFQFYNVLYGSEIIDEIKRFICDSFSCFENLDNRTIKRFVLSPLAQKLQDLQYSAKLSKYKQENEARLVLFVPQLESCPEDFSPLYPEVKENGKSYVYITLKKDRLRGVFANEYVDSQTKMQLKQTLLTNEYEADVK